MTLALGTDQHVILIRSDFLPERILGRNYSLGSSNVLKPEIEDIDFEDLQETTLDKLTLLGDFKKRSSAKTSVSYHG